VGTPATGLDIGDLNSDRTSDTTGETTKCGSHTGNNTYISSDVDTSDVPTEIVATDEGVTEEKPASKIIPAIPSRLRQAVAGVVAAATMAISGLPAAAAPVAPQNPVAPKPAESSQLVQPQEHHWDELPRPGATLCWVNRGGTEKLILKGIDPDGRCQVKSLLSGFVTNTRIGQLKPVSG
jgi:hypothetical protein